MQTLATWTKKFALFALFYLVFAYGGQFTPTQSAILALLTDLVIWLVQEQNRHDEFKPFFVEIRPHWPLIVRDYNLTDEKHFEEVRQKLYHDKTSPKPYHVLTDGIVFTALGPRLFYSHHYHRFSSQLGFMEEIVEFKNSPSITGSPPRFYAEKRGDFLELGLETLGSDDPDFIPLARIPLAEFFGTSTNPAFLRKLTNQLKAEGWQLEPDSGLIVDNSLSLKHKYFTVYHREI